MPEDGKLTETSVLEPQRSCWDPKVTEALYDFLGSVDLANSDLDLELRTLLDDHGDAVYPELIYLLSHLRFGSGEAKRTWHEILEHRDSMRRHLARPVDLRVALVSYFLDVNRKYDNPTVIELTLFEKTHEFAYRDELTGLPNYRFFSEYLEQEILRSRRSNTPMSLVMVDVDDFKLYNDAHGHEAGNEALAAIARIVQASIREHDFAARYGGEEFTLILPCTPKVEAEAVAERVRASAEAHRFPGTEGPGMLTLSLGIATHPGDADDAEQLIRLADRAMYTAKATGKNRVRLYDDNRRSYKRIDVTLPGTYRALANERHPLTTVNMSEGGILFRTDRPIAMNALIEFKLEMPGDDGDVSASGRVVSLRQVDGGFQVAVRIVQIPTRDLSVLSRHIRQRGRPV